MSANTEGSAFPFMHGTYSRTGNDFVVHYESGMTLRDYFAAKALAGMLADPNVKGPPKLLAGAAYEIADAMIAERNRKL